MIHRRVMVGHTVDTTDGVWIGRLVVALVDDHLPIQFLRRLVMSNKKFLLY